jgi:hypothetical protein
MVVIAAFSRDKGRNGRLAWPPTPAGLSVRSLTLTGLLGDPA